MIHVLAEGRVTESGTHDSLLKQKGIYAGLWSVQTGDVRPTSTDRPAIVQN